MGQWTSPSSTRGVACAKEDSQGALGKQAITAQEHNTAPAAWKNTQPPRVTNIMSLCFFRPRKQTGGGHLHRVTVWGGSCSGTSPWRPYLWRPHLTVHLSVEELLGKPLRYPQLGRPCRPLAREGWVTFLEPLQNVRHCVQCFSLSHVSKISSVFTPQGIWETSS